MVDFVEGGVDGDPVSFQVALDAGEQVGRFFASDGSKIENPEVFDPALTPGLFEVPIVPPLPEDLNFLF